MTAPQVPPRVIEKPAPRLLRVTEIALEVATRRPAYDAARINVILNNLQQQLRMQRVYLRHHDFTTAGEQYLAEIERAARRLDELGLA